MGCKFCCVLGGGLRGQKHVRDDGDECRLCAGLGGCVPWWRGSSRNFIDLESGRCRLCGSKAGEGDSRTNSDESNSGAYARLLVYELPLLASAG